MQKKIKNRDVLSIKRMLEQIIRDGDDQSKLIAATARIRLDGIDEDQKKSDITIFILFLLFVLSLAFLFVNSLRTTDNGVSLAAKTPDIQKLNDSLESTKAKLDYAVKTYDIKFRQSKKGDVVYMDISSGKLEECEKNYQNLLKINANNVSIANSNSKIHEDYKKRVDSVFRIILDKNKGTK